MRYTFEKDGIFVNPELPENFNITPNEERSEDEISEWWDNPYILIYELEQESWIEHYERLTNEDDWNDEQVGTQESWEKELSKHRKYWYETWHTGFKYEVRCLDGGAWDRSTWHGSFATFEEALKVAKKIKLKNTI